jgi:hypothetical protein
MQKITFFIFAFILFSFKNNQKNPELNQEGTIDDGKHLSFTDKECQYLYPYFRFPETAKVNQYSFISLFRNKNSRITWLMTNNT